MRGWGLGTRVDAGISDNIVGIQLAQAWGSKLRIIVGGLLYYSFDYSKVGKVGTVHYYKL